MLLWYDIMKLFPYLDCTSLRMLSAKLRAGPFHSMNSSIAAF